MTVRNLDTNARRTAVTDAQGRWRVPNLPVGNYEIKNTRIFRDHVLQFRCEMFNLTNTRSFGIPEGRIHSATF